MWLLKESIETLVPFLIILLSLSLSSTEFPSLCKRAVVYLHIKQVASHAYADDVQVYSSYHP